MKAARIHRFGGPEVIRIEDVPILEPAAGELLIQARTSSVNPVDYKIRQGGYLGEDKLPLTLGRDVFGIVEGVGVGATDGLDVGDGVVVMLPPDQGGNAEFVAAPASACARWTGDNEGVAGSLGLAALTAWQVLFDHGRLASGERVLVHGAAGGVGHLAAQLARVRGADVFATCAGEDVEFVRALGVPHVIDYRSRRFEDDAPDIDLVLDLIGDETGARSLAVLVGGGRLIASLPLSDGTKAGADAKGVRAVAYHAAPNGPQLREVVQLVTSGAVRPHVDRMLPLDRIAEAHDVIEHDHVRGKIVLSIA